MINETITLNENEELDVEVSRIQYEQNLQSNPTTFIRLNFSFEDLNSSGGAELSRDPSGDYDTLTIDENSLEKLIRDVLAGTLNTKISSFRWTWDKHRYCNG